MAEDSSGPVPVTHGLPETGGHALTNEAPEVPHADPKALFLDPTGWVSLAMATFIAILLWKGVPRLIGRMLDGQIAAIRTRLDEAAALRAEAEKLRDEYARKIANVAQETEAMVLNAETEAKALIAKAEIDARDLAERRGRMAEDKIAAAERQAIADIRSKAAEAASKAAAAIIAQHHGADADRALVDRTIAGLNRLN